MDMYTALEGGAILDILTIHLLWNTVAILSSSPEEWYEERGLFECYIHLRNNPWCEAEGAICYGCTDTYVGLAFTEVDEIVSYIKEHSVVTEEDTEIGKIINLQL